MRTRVFLLFFFYIATCSCKKSADTTYKIYQGTLIGFDPCTGDYTNNSKKGYVVKIYSVSETGDTIILDTATTYNLPTLFQFDPNLFLDYQISYLFPPAFLDSFHLSFTFDYTPESKKVQVLCTTDINTGGFYAATKGAQFIIKKVY